MSLEMVKELAHIKGGTEHRVNFKLGQTFRASLNSPGITYRGITSSGVGRQSECIQRCTAEITLYTERGTARKQQPRKLKITTDRKLFIDNDKCNRHEYYNQLEKFLYQDFTLQDISGLASFFSTALKTLISVSTVILLGLIFAYHALEVQDIIL
ncbi:hypothetical protein DBV15_03696 [Temnothorax longispinosus]|uniref:Uncharacterized protein n=1 Tax=Temnothorax longispinosus TaxID=300112 RepID=A0A4S2KE67_9HYME|nr:hypothetical protein DBV15_03696 [Temnothorax longispinosus]